MGVQERLYTKANHRDSINSEHRQRAMLERYDDCTHSLREIYEDKDGGRKEEVSALSGPNEFAEFYARLKQIKDFHRRHPGEVSVPMSTEFEELKKLREGGSSANAGGEGTTVEKGEVMVDFTGEESYGKYLDLHECYEKYVNLKGVDKQTDYVTYLTVFDRLYECVPPHL